MFGGRSPPGRFLGWEERGQLLPLFIRQVASVHHATEFTQPDLFCKHTLVFTVEDADSGTVAIAPFEVNMGGFPSRQVLIDGAQLRPEREYLMTIQGVDANGNLIQRTGENTGLSPSEQFILASKEFMHRPPEAPKFEFTIDSINADFEADRLNIMLKVPSNAQVLKFDGFIVDDTGQRVGSATEDLYRGTTLSIPMPEAIREASEAHKYKVTLNLYTKDDQQAQAAYDFTIVPPARPGPFQRVGAALIENPPIALVIMVTMSIAAIVIIFLGQRPQIDIPDIGRGPHDSTQAINQHARHGRLGVRIVQAPGPCRGTERLITDFPCLVGRDEGCEICIKDDRGLSRKHLEIDWQDGHFIVKDISLNGTFVNGSPLQKGVATRISGVASVRLGNCTLDLDAGE